MGYYIEVGVPERFKKANQLVRLYKGEIIPRPKSFSDIPDGKALICVISNGSFEAAGFCFSNQEFSEFGVNDGRPRQWVLLDLNLTKKLTNFY